MAGQAIYRVVSGVRGEDDPDDFEDEEVARFVRRDTAEYFIGVIPFGRHGKPNRIVPDIDPKSLSLPVLGDDLHDAVNATAVAVADVADLAKALDAQAKSLRASLDERRADLFGID